MRSYTWHNVMLNQQNDWTLTFEGALGLLTQQRDYEAETEGDMFKIADAIERDPVKISWVCGWMPIVGRCQRPGCMTKGRCQGFVAE